MRLRNRLFGKMAVWCQCAKLASSSAAARPAYSAKWSGGVENMCLREAY
jgi:hypothetical protein